MNKAIIAIIIILVVIGGIYFLTRGDGADTTPTVSATPTLTTTPTATPTPISGTGKIIIDITDKAADMTAVSEVTMTLTKTEVHSQAKGWTTVWTGSNTFKLLSLKSTGHPQFAGSASVSSGFYDEVRLTIDKVVVKTKDGGQKTAKLPSGVFTVMTNAMVNGKQTSSVKIDILADKSLHTAATGEYVFAPTAEVEARTNVTASVDSHDVVTVTGGTVSSNTKAGMDLDGTVKADFMIDPAAVIKLEGGILKLSTAATGTPAQ